MATPVLAIADPDSMSVDEVYVYRNCREVGDQMYLVTYTITYASPPTESVSEAFLCRLMDGTTELASVAPFTYHNNGYDEGVVAIYFSAENAPDWEGAYTMELTGNPALGWSGDPPTDTDSTFDLWQDNGLAITHVVLSSRIIDLATELETDWSLDMVQQNSETGEYTLTMHGEAYFSGVVPYLPEVAPFVFEDVVPPVVVEPEIEDPDTSAAYADSLETGILGTVLDITPLADEFGVGRGQLTAILYYAAVLLFLIKVSQKLQSQKPLMILSIPLVVLGAFVGVPLVVTILAAFVAIFFIAWSVFYKPSTA